MPLNLRTGLPVNPTPLKDGAKRTQRTVRTLRNWMDRGLLTKYMLGGRVYVDINELDTLLVAEPRSGDAA